MDADLEYSDVLIVGGGYGGLSAALTTYRAQLKTIIFDTNEPRNSWDTKIRLLPTWDSKTHSNYKVASRHELESTGLVNFVDVRVVSIIKESDVCFRVTDATGKQWIGRRVLLAVGTINLLPSIPGYADNFPQNM